ncbi:MAG TPA: hypothetical protein VJC37_08095 [Planctomycetota bacterium]|nr:hypothetical protein [Planctomycetota bacterium]
MIKNAKILERFEREQISTERLGYARKLLIFDALWDEYRRLNRNRIDNPLDGIASRIRIARILNSAKGSRPR